MLNAVPRLTVRGRVVFVVVVAVYVCSVLWHYKALAVLSCAIFAALVIGGLWTLPRLHVSAERSIHPTRVVRGALSRALLRYRSESRLPMPRSTIVDRCGQWQILTDVPRVRGGTWLSVSYDLPTDRRGVFECGPILFVKNDPFGLWQSTTRVDVEERIYVHPRIHELFGLPRGLTRSLDGLDTDRLAQGNITFRTLRAYVVGDDMRRVHWKASAHSGGGSDLLVKELVDTSVPQFTIVIDCFQEHYSESTFEEAAEIAASVAVAAGKAGFPVRLFASDRRLISGTGTVPDIPSVLDALAGLELEERIGIAATVVDLAREKRGDIVLVVTGAPSDAAVRAINSATRRFGWSVVVAVKAEAGDTNLQTFEGTNVLTVDTARAFATLWNKSTSRQ
jgi:uncharacterized protein (DUF58 family)